MLQQGCKNPNENTCTKKVINLDETLELQWKEFMKTRLEMIKFEYEHKTSVILEGIFKEIQKTRLIGFC